MSHHCSHGDSESGFADGGASLQHGQCQGLHRRLKGLHHTTVPRKAFHVHSSAHKQHSGCPHNRHTHRHTHTDTSQCEFSGVFSAVFGRCITYTTLPSVCRCC